MANTKERAETQLTLILSHVQALCFSSTPSQKLSFQGLKICSVSGRARLAEYRVAAFRRCLTQFQLGRRLCFRTVLQLLDMMASMIAVVSLGLLKMCAFQRWTRSHQLCTKRHLRRELAITPSCMSALLPESGSRHRQGVFSQGGFHRCLPKGMAVTGVWTQAQRQLQLPSLVATIQTASI